MIFQCDVLEFIDNYVGPKHHALLCDPPYHLDGGFMGKEWDKGNIAFDPDTWSGLARHLHPGAFGFVYSSASTFTEVAGAIKEAELILYPALFGWIYGTGMGRGAKIDNEGFSGHRYGKIALKQSIEPILCFRVPYEGKPVESMSKYGSGALNIDGSVLRSIDSNGEIVERYPPNVVLDENAAKQLDIATDQDVSKYFFRWSDATEELIAEASALKYVPKASRKERDIGLESFDETKVGVLQGRQDGSFEGPIPMGKNDHPTVKPIKLNQWLASLLLPPDIFVKRRLLNPFGGTGSETIGGYNAGWESVTMVEIDRRYVEYAIARIRATAEVAERIVVETETGQ